MSALRANAIDLYIFLGDYPIDRLAQETRSNDPMSLINSQFVIDGSTT